MSASNHDRRPQPPISACPDCGRDYDATTDGKGPTAGGGVPRKLYAVFLPNGRLSSVSTEPPSDWLREHDFVFAEYDAAPAPAEGEADYDRRLRLLHLGLKVAGEQLDDEQAKSVGAELIALSGLCSHCRGTGEDGDESGIGACGACNGTALAHPTPPPAAAQAFSAANPSSVNDLPAATDIGVGSTPAAAHREVGEVVAYVEAYIDGYDQRCRGLVWADHPANTPGRTFEPLVQASALAAERERAERMTRERDRLREEVGQVWGLLMQAQRTGDVLIGKIDTAEARAAAAVGVLREAAEHVRHAPHCPASETGRDEHCDETSCGAVAYLARIDALLEPGDGG